MKTLVRKLILLTGIVAVTLAFAGCDTMGGCLHHQPTYTKGAMSSNYNK